jgi:cytoskeletal protein CcmA (bactofilin family)
LNQNQVQREENAMFGKSNDKPETAIQQPQSAAPTRPAPRAPAERVQADPVSTIGRGVTVVGKIVGEGTVHVLGQVEGEVRALTVLIGEGATVEGDLVAEELTIGGMVRGTIHANRVRLNGTAIVDGDIFHQSLSIEENARFEGSSKRADSAVDVLRTLLQQHTAAQEADTKASVIQGSWKANGASTYDESLTAEAS